MNLNTRMPFVTELMIIRQKKKRVERALLQFRRVHKESPMWITGHSVLKLVISCLTVRGHNLMSFLHHNGLSRKNTSIHIHTEAAPEGALQTHLSLTLSDL